jgi:hypothetical protein
VDQGCEISDPQAPLQIVGAEEVQGAPTWGLSELWRAAGLREGANLTLPTSARVSRDGTLAVPDFALGTVWLFGSDGEWLGSAGVRGQGPGELVAPIAVGWSDDDQLFVLDAGQMKMERFDLSNGTSVTLSIPSDLMAPVASAGEVGWFGIRGDGMAFLEFPIRTSDAPSVAVRFARAGPGDKEVQTAWQTDYPLATAPGYNRPSRPEWPRTLIGVGREVWVVAPRSSRYELLIYDRSESPRTHLCVGDREVFGQGHERLTDVDTDRVREVEALPASGEAALFSRVVVDADDRIWVERTLPRSGAPWDALYGTPGALLDLLSSEGEFIGRLRMPEGLRFQDARGDTLWAFHIGHLQEIEVVSSRLVGVQ